MDRVAGPANEYSHAHHVTWSPNKLGDLPTYLTYFKIGQSRRRRLVSRKLMRPVLLGHIFIFDLVLGTNGNWIRNALKGRIRIRNKSLPDPTSVSDSFSFYTDPVRIQHFRLNTDSDPGF
jgi:hypothetical protein